MALYNVNLETRECIEQRTVDWKYLELEEFITNLREAAVGLTEPTVDVNADSDGYDFLNHEIVVSGARLLTDNEVASIKAERERVRRYHQHMASFQG